MIIIDTEKYHIEFYEGPDYNKNSVDNIPYDDVINSQPRRLNNDSFFSYILLLLKVHRLHSVF